MFNSETENAQGGGLVVEIWTKGMLWDRALGYQFITLDMIPYGYPNEVTAKWWPLDQEVILMNGEVAGTKNPTGHMLLLDCRFELPYGGKNFIHLPIYLNYVINYLFHSLYLSSVSLLLFFLYNRTCTILVLYHHNYINTLLVLLLAELIFNL